MQAVANSWQAQHMRCHKAVSARTTWVMVRMHAHNKGRTNNLQQAPSAKPSPQRQQPRLKFKAAQSTAPAPPVQNAHQPQAITQQDRAMQVLHEVQQYQQHLQEQERLHREWHKQRLQPMLQQHQFQFADLGPLPASMVASLQKSEEAMAIILNMVQQLEKGRLGCGRPLPPEEVEQLQDPANLLQLQDLALSDMRYTVQYFSDQLQGAPYDLGLQELHRKASERLLAITDEYVRLEYDIRQAREQEAAWERTRQALKSTVGHLFARRRL